MRSTARPEAVTRCVRSPLLQLPLTLAQGFIKTLVRLVQDGSSLRKGAPACWSVWREEVRRSYSEKGQERASTASSTDHLRLQRSVRTPSWLGKAFGDSSHSYAPALRPLRPMARTIRFTPPTNVMVVRRLTDICAKESFGADAKSLTMLVDVVKGDLRSCLNTLQVRTSSVAACFLIQSGTAHQEQD